MGNERYAIKQSIMQMLRSVPNEASDAAKYFADRLLDTREQYLSNDAISVLAVESMARALLDYGCSKGDLHSGVKELSQAHGEEIATIAAMMAMYVDSKKKPAWKPSVIAAGVGIAALALLGG